VAAGTAARRGTGTPTRPLARAVAGRARGPHAATRRRPGNSRTSPRPPAPT
jgi:hypothetical protein